MESKVYNIVFFCFLSFALASCGVSRRAVPTEYKPVNVDYACRGRLEEVICPSSQPGLTERRMMVYLPENYDDTTKDFPVLYLLHGARGSELSWIQKGHILQNVDRLVAEGKARPMIVVMPNTSQYKDDRDYAKSREKHLAESFFEINGTVEKIFVKDVVGTVDSLYRTVRKREGRAIAGLSIGALQSIFISATHPELFDYVGLFSPMTRPATCHGKDSDFYDALKKKLAVQFQDPPQLYWVMTGVWDIFYDLMQHFKFYLNRQHYPYEFYMSPGGHTWKNWEDYCNMFLERIF